VEATPPRRPSRFRLGRRQPDLLVVPSVSLYAWTGPVSATTWAGVDAIRTSSHRIECHMEGSSQQLNVERAPAPTARHMTNTDELRFALGKITFGTRVGRRENIRAPGPLRRRRWPR